MHSQSLKKLFVLVPALLQALPALAAAVSVPRALPLNTDIEIVQTSDSATTDLIEVRQLPKDLIETIVSVGIVGGFLYGQGVSFYGLGKECDSAKLGEDGGTRDCVLAVTAKIINAMLAAKGTVESIKKLKTMSDMYIGQMARQRRALVAREAESALSDMFGSRVRHIGQWTDDTSSSLSARDDAPAAATHPVFGTQLDGVDVHFAMTGVNETDGSHTFRLGFGNGNGNGGVVGSSAGGLGRRGGGDALFFNDYGLEYQLLHMDIPGGQPIEPSKEVERSVYEQLKCRFTTDEYEGVLLGESNQMWLQIYDERGSGTVMAGKLAPFGRDGRSQLGQMGDYMGSVDLDYQCMPTPWFR
ncbi:hypothetical protein LY78DRAFT_692587 [Colletotrichum sublineola]|nr:hypothetical protein LY78DRAFT_692587 [Colletotrichum sublineola]